MSNILVPAVPAEGAAVDPAEAHDEGQHHVRQLPTWLHPAGHRGGGEADGDDVPSPGDHIQ